MREREGHRDRRTDRKMDEPTGTQTPTHTKLQPETSTALFIGHL